MADPFETGPDSRHRHIPGVLAIGCIAALLMTLVTGVNRYGSPTSLLVILESDVYLPSPLSARLGS